MRFATRLGKSLTHTTFKGCTVSTSHDLARNKGMGLRRQTFATSRIAPTISLAPGCTSLEYLPLEPAWSTDHPISPKVSWYKPRAARIALLTTHGGAYSALDIHNSGSLSSGENALATKYSAARRSTRKEEVGRFDGSVAERARS